jgi:hypothetical protein
VPECRVQRESTLDGTARLSCIQDPTPREVRRQSSRRLPAPVSRDLCWRRLSSNFGSTSGTIQTCGEGSKEEDVLPAERVHPHPQTGVFHARRPNFSRSC